MSNLRIFAIGEPPSFRQEVAQAASTSAEAIGWMSDESHIESILGGSDRADVLVLSPTLSDESAIALAQVAARFSPTTAVVVVREGNMNGALPSFMRAGVRDVVDTSGKSDDLSEAVERAMSWAGRVKAVRASDADHGAGGSVISVFSSKGGTGKTFLASNLAAAVSERRKQDTALVDLDLAMGDVFSYWGKEPTRPFQDLIGLGHMVDREAILQTGTKLGENLWGFGAPPDPAAAGVSSEAIETVLEALKKNFAYTIVDGAAGYTDQILPALDYSDKVCLVAGLDVVGIKHLSKALETLSSIGLPPEKLVVVLNRADSKVGLDTEDVQRVLGITIDSMIPSSRLVPMSLNKGEPIYFSEKDSEVARAIGELADRISAGTGTSVTGSQEIAKKSKLRNVFGRS